MLSLSRALPTALHRLQSVSLPRASAARLPLRRTFRRCTMASAAVAAPAGVREDYSALCERLREISALSGVSGLLGWDEQARDEQAPHCSAASVALTRPPPGDDAQRRSRPSRPPGLCPRRRDFREGDCCRAGLAHRSPQRRRFGRSWAGRAGAGHRARRSTRVPAPRGAEQRAGAARRCEPRWKARRFVFVSVSRTRQPFRLSQRA